MANYKTPGVYVNEVSLLPPSVAPVATAIPAFIGYTEKAFEKESLHLKPFRISSMLDYETYFGYAYPQKGIEVAVDGDTITQIDGLNDTPSFKMYYALQMYFANGGGPCYIVSIGDYSTANISVTDHENGLSAVEKEDEPTLLVFPDATELSNASNYYSVMNKGLAQSNKLQDRFTIIDTYKDGAIGTSDNPIPELRNGIINDESHRKYGAAYYPYLKTIIDYFYNDSEVNVKIEGSNIEDYINSIWDEIIDNNDDLDGLAESFSELLAAFPQLLTTLLEDEPEEGGGIDPDKKKEGIKLITGFLTIFTEYQNRFTLLINTLEAMLINQGKNEAQDLTPLKDLKDWVKESITDNIPVFEESLEDFYAATKKEEVANILSVIDIILEVYDDNGEDKFKFVDYINELNTEGPEPEIPEEPEAPEEIQILSEPEPVEEPENWVYQIITNITSGSSFIFDIWPLAVLKDEDNLLYNQIKQAIADVPMLLPPSSTIAGVYARIDNSVGVWKAPANTGLTYVIGPSQIISNDDQEDMNVTGTGKSVNAIRSFTGKGTLVWGARTLDGNSNEWRYINVRRFYNFAEESIRKATEPFVFQSNDANTWVMMRGMIESFLTLQWKAGALAGASTEQAFYVNVGLGSTMTTQDILEGRMIVEIGMAVVRPAEFIILRFTHKMQEI